MTPRAPDPESCKRMEGFDALPAAVRAALNDADYPFPVPVAVNLLRRLQSADRAATAVVGLDRRPGWKGGA